jgi:hypothetical protein
VLAGQDPHNFCTDMTATNQCGNDGTCDGAGACRNVSTSKICIPASCNTATNAFTPAVTCDGNGTCPPAAPVACGAFQCATTGCPKTCAKQADCGSGNYCNIASGATSGTCAATKANGATAVSTFECTSGVIADGVCCNATCSGCSACTKALNGQTDGQCINVPAGQVAHSACAASGTTCGLDGYCDGANKCRFPAAGTSCGTSCLGSTLTTKTCDGAGVCGSANSTCGGGLVCGATTCKTTCASDNDCVTGDYCSSGGTCATKLANGATCSTSNQCPTGNTCVEGVCCSSACGIACKSCKTAGATGTCAFVAPGTPCGAGSVCSAAGSCGACSQGSCPPPNQPCKTGTLDCSTGAQVCNATGNSPAGQSCGTAASCNSSTKQATPAQVCNGSGTCPSVTAVNCPYGCNGTVCATAKPQGATCASGAECGAGVFCTDGVCCASASCGTCKACNINGAGTCSPKPSTASDSACPVSAANCMAGCDGAGNCKPAGQGTVCGAGVCTNGTPGNGQFTAPNFRTRTCNGTTASSSACQMGTGNVGCQGNLVCLDATTCRQSCVQETDCADGYYCAAGTCVVRLPTSLSSVCSRDQQCLSRVCLGTCVECDTIDDCPRTRPACVNHACVRCDADQEYVDEMGCHVNPNDGSMDPQLFCGTRTYPQSNYTCGCGSVNECPIGSVCTGSSCLIRGGQPCVTDNCAFGHCPSGGGTCPWEQPKLPCTQTSSPRSSSSGCDPAQGGCTGLCWEPNQYGDYACCQ